MKFKVNLVGRLKDSIFNVVLINWGNQKLNKKGKIIKILHM